VANTTRDRYSRLTWWQMPVPGGTTRYPSKACWAQRRSLVALDVALVLDVDVLVEGPGVPEASAITEWSMTSSTGTSGFDLGRVPAEGPEGVAHGGQVDDGGHAGEVPA